MIGGSYDTFSNRTRGKKIMLFLHCTLYSHCEQKCICPNSLEYQITPIENMENMKTIRDNF